MSDQKNDNEMRKKISNISLSSSFDKKPKNFAWSSDTFSTAILYRDSVTGAAKIHPFDPTQIDEDDILNFFKYYKCYDIIHQNTKLVILDTR